VEEQERPSTEMEEGEGWGGTKTKKVSDPIKVNFRLDFGAD